MREVRLVKSGEEGGSDTGSRVGFMVTEFGCL